MKVGDEGVPLFGRDLNVAVGWVAVAGGGVTHGVARHGNHARRSDDAGVRHEIAGFHAVGFGDPAVEVFRGVLEETGGNRAARSDAGEVGADIADTVMAADGVTSCTTIFDKRLATGGDQGGIFVGVGSLQGVPAAERIRVKFGDTTGLFDIERAVVCARGGDLSALGCGDGAGRYFLIRFYLFCIECFYYRTPRRLPALPSSRLDLIED